MYLPGASRSKCQTWWSKYKFIGSSSRSVPALNCKTAKILTCSGPCSSARHQAAQMSPHWSVDSAAGTCSCQTSPRRKIIHYWIKHVQDVNMFEGESSRRISYFPWAHALKLSFGYFSLCASQLFRSNLNVLEFRSKSSQGLQMIGSLALLSSFLICLLPVFLPVLTCFACLLFTFYLLP